jgi:hypothetical protein
MQIHSRSGQKLKAREMLKSRSGITSYFYVRAFFLESQILLDSIDHVGPFSGQVCSRFSALLSGVSSSLPTSPSRHALKTNPKNKRKKFISIPSRVNNTPFVFLLILSFVCGITK